mmetsp:Transcript_31882/g.92338  ORF Transcript_31882/g.92338 Transcript_31882/m.92338 type:complete len:239 (-) Transcript_31882:63-779(-)
MGRHQILRPSKQGRAARCPGSFAGRRGVLGGARGDHDEHGDLGRDHIPYTGAGLPTDDGHTAQSQGPTSHTHQWMRTLAATLSVAHLSCECDRVRMCVCEFFSEVVPEECSHVSWRFRCESMRFCLSTALVFSTLAFETCVEVVWRTCWWWTARKCRGPLFGQLPVALCQERPLCGHSIHRPPTGRDGHQQDVTATRHVAREQRRGPCSTSCQTRTCREANAGEASRPNCGGSYPLCP